MTPSRATVDARATRASRFAAGIGALLFAATVSSAAVDRPADARPTTGSERTAQMDDAVALELIDQRFSVDADGSLQLTYQVTGLVDDPLELIPPPAPTTTTTPPTSSAPDAAESGAPTTTVAPPAPPEPVQLTVEVANYQPVSDPADIADLVGSDVSPEAFSQVSDVVDGVAIDVRPLAERADDGTVTFTLDIGTDVESSVEDRLKFDRAGLWPLRVQLLVGDPTSNRVVATAGTIVQRLADPGDPPAPPPIDLSVVVAVAEPPTHGSETDIERTDEEFTAAVDLAAALDAPVTLEVPPDLVARATSTPQAADDMARSLADDELIAMPLVPLDVSSAVAAGRADAYTRLVIGGVDVLTESVPTTPTRRDVWISTEPLSAPGAQHLRDLGVRFLIFPQELYRSTIDRSLPARDLFVEATLPDGTTMPILVVDDLSAQLTSEAADEVLERSTTTEWAVGALAEIVADQTGDDAEAARDDDRTGPRAERSRILSTPDLQAPDSRLLNALHSLAETTPSVRFTAASTLTGLTDTQQDASGAVTVQLPEIAGPSLTERITLIDATAITMASAASMLPADDPRPAAWTAELDGLISTSYTDADVVEATAALTAEADRLRDAVVLPEPFTFTLTGREGTVETRLGNLSDVPLTVVLHPESAKVAFPDGDQTVTLRPRDETAVIVPIEARSNGTSSIDLSVSTPAGEVIDAPVTLTARVTALTGLGQVLTAGFVLVLLTWWFSHWRSRHREQQDEDVPERDPDGTDENERDERADEEADGTEPTDDELESDSL